MRSKPKIGIVDINRKRGVSWRLRDFALQYRYYDELVLVAWKSKPALLEMVIHQRLISKIAIAIRESASC